MEQVGRGQARVGLVAALWCCTVSAGSNWRSVACKVQPVRRVASSTLSKSARLSPAKVNRVRDLGCRFSVVRAERFRTQANETRNETRA
jgi:hypothetical protein